MGSGIVNLYVAQTPGTPERDLAIKLRGGPVFDVFGEQSDTYGVRAFRAEVGQAPQPIRKALFNVAFVDLDDVVDHPEYWAVLRARCTSVIVDVHFPLGRPDMLRAVQPGLAGDSPERDRDADSAARDRWADPARLALAARIIGTATHVVSPHKAWAQTLERWTRVERLGLVIPRSVDVLPDVTSIRSGGQFYRYLVRSFSRDIARASTAPWWARGLAWAWNRALEPMAVTAMQRDLADVDFSYARVS